ncbi:MAG: protein kinase domain-containing protein [Pyrinomonadaceae bacterium]
MTPEHWQQIEELFHAALARKPDERADFLARACAGDEALRSEVESLLRSHALGESFIEESAADVAAEMLAGGQAKLAAGRRIGHYEIKRLLGAGGMGEVYLAEDMRLGRPVALKLLPAQFTAEQDRVRRFEQEARAASALNHPNIVTIHEIGQTDSARFIATEFIAGETLRRRMDSTRMALGEVLDITTQVASALAAAHEVGVVHRDIKPDNIMLRPDGYVKVLDFGLAKLVEQRKLAAQPEAPPRAKVKTQTGMVLGTVTYMSPEQARGEEVDVRTDIWSLGIMLYELLAGRVPFAGKTPSHVIVSLLEDEPPPLARYAEVPAELARIVSKALRKDRAERYQRAGEMAHDLKTLKQELEVEARLKRTLQPDAGGIGVDTAGGGRAVVETAQESAASTADIVRVHTSSSAKHSATEFKRHKMGIVVAAVAVLVVAALAYFLYFANSSEVIDSVAVLPFVNASSDPEAEYLSDGISDNIINSLSRLPNLRVISLNAVLRYKGQQADPAAVGRALNVRAVLLGRMVQHGDSLEISTELVDVRDNRRLWGEQYKRKLADILDLQGEIAREISERLRLRLTGAEQKQLAKNYTQNPEAYELYLKGRYFFDKRTVGGFRRSKEYFQEAIKKDPNYALAYAGLANAYTPSDFMLLPTETMAEAKAAAKRALELDNTLAEAHTAQARILLFYDLDWQGAERELKRAIELNPNYTESHHMYSHYLIYVGQIEQSLAESRRALELDPLDALLNVHLGWHYLYARQYDQALEQMHKAIEMEPNFFRAHLFLGRAYEQKGMYKEALAAYQRALALEVDSAETVVMLGHLYAVSGERAEALRVLDGLRERYKKKEVSAYDLAIIYVGLGEREQALAWLRQAYEERFGGLLLLKADPIFDSLRSDPRYQDLLRRMNLTP